MQILRPIQISDVALVSSTVAVADPDAVNGYWDTTATYSVGAVVQVDNDGTGTKPNFTFTASGKIITCSAAHYLYDRSTVSLTTTGALPAGLSPGTLYYVVNGSTKGDWGVKTTLNLSLTKGGAPIITASAGTGTHTLTVNSHGVVDSNGRIKIVQTHRLYECLVAVLAGTNLEPRKAPATWFDIGASNRWALFDAKNSTQTENADSVTYVIQTKGRIDGVYVGNVSAASITITGRESGGGAIVYGPSTYQLVSTLTISSYYAWFYDPIERKKHFIDLDLSATYTDLELTMTLTDTGSTVKCGTLVVGLSKTFGETLREGATAGIVDYSSSSIDDYGEQSFSERGYSDRMSLQIIVDRLATDAVKYELTKYRATPIVYVGSTLYESLIVYGYFKSFSVAMTYESHSICTIEVESIT